MTTNEATATTTKTTTVEVWLRTGTTGIWGEIIKPDESGETQDIDSRSMNGAQREITSYLISQGYAPVGRWKIEDGESGLTTECSRTFRPPITN